MKQAKIEKKQLNELILWDKNPRAIHEVDYKRLKDLIIDLGLFKPFVVNQDNVILGGNMRYRVCQDLGYKEVFVSVVKTDDEAQMFSYALADNDRAGYYEEDKVAELVLKNPALKLDLYKLDLGYNSPIRDVVNLFTPNADSFENLSEEDLENYLEENQNKELLKIFTTIENARKIKELIQKNKNGLEDEGLVLLNLIK